jgi:hypothetical protein
MKEAEKIAKIIATRTTGAATGTGRAVEIVSTVCWVIGVILEVVG